jgi:two-component system response regulator MprA
MYQPGEVLVVDGDASIRSLLEVVVRMLPRRPVVAVDGRSAVALLAHHTFDALVLDLILPELSGFEVLRFVAERAPELLARTIVLTTVPESRWGTVEETHACAAVLRKPFSLDELQSALRVCCENGVPN